MGTSCHSMDILIWRQKQKYSLGDGSQQENQQETTESNQHSKIKMSCLRAKGKKKVEGPLRITELKINTKAREEKGLFHISS
ncbi:hypothetical protein Y1Q_0019339 [Alligator mississippiensis]|uniref:Uncharacterized protein n=1 Tax=Alligator mississippiensis TaxID=8496 RepID=A0A151MQV2_ALLMI|nr:hypothetical protein Y1Q_0019339 [Alligator mississippiensis]